MSTKTSTQRLRRGEKTHLGWRKLIDCGKGAIGGGRCASSLAKFEIKVISTPHALLTSGRISTFHFLTNTKHKCKLADTIATEPIDDCSFCSELRHAHCICFLTSYTTQSLPIYDSQMSNAKMQRCKGTPAAMIHALVLWHSKSARMHMNSATIIAVCL